VHARLPADAARIPVFRRTRVVRERDCDQLGHVNNLSWVRWVVEVAEAHSAALGFPFETMRARGGVWVVRHQDLHYLRGAHPGDEIRETTWVSTMRAATSTRHARFHAADGTLLFAANTLWAFVDVARLRPRRVLPDVVARFDLVAPDAVPENAGAPTSAD
jgi:acyl-CoA thioester hydrolase